MDETKKIFDDIESEVSSNRNLYYFDSRAWDKDVIYRKMMALVVNSTDGNKKITKKQYKQISDICQHYNVVVVPTPVFVVFRIKGKGTGNLWVTTESHCVSNTPHFGYLHRQIKECPNDIFYIYYAKDGRFRYDKIVDEVPEKLDNRTLRILKLRKLKNKSG